MHLTYTYLGDLLTISWDMLDARIWWTLSSTPRLWRVLPCLGSMNRRSNGGVVKLEKHLGIFMNFKLYSPENSHGNMVTWKSAFRKGTSSSKPPFLGSTLVFGGVYNMLYFSACSNDFLSRLLPFTRRWRTPLGFRWHKKLQELPYQVGQILTQESQLFNKIQTILQALLVPNNSPAIACKSQFLKWKLWSPYTQHQLHIQSRMFSRNPKHQSISYSNFVSLSRIASNSKASTFLQKSCRKKFTSGAWHCL